MSLYTNILDKVNSYGATLVVVSKMQPLEKIMMVYEEGQRIFGENRPQELSRKHQNLPEDVQWHLIGNLQKNKIRQILPFVRLIHSVDSLELAMAINAEALRIGITTDVLLEIKIAREESKHGFLYRDLTRSLKEDAWLSFSGIRVGGVMGIGSLCNDNSETKSEFKYLRRCFEEIRDSGMFGPGFSTVSMGMSSDFEIALEEGSTMVRVGSAAFADL